MTMPTMVARVAVAAAVYSIDRPYDYAVPQTLAEPLFPGARVLVPFGRGDKLSEGFVLEVTSRQEDNLPLKSIAYVFSKEISLSPQQQALALWMCRRCFCTYYQAAAALLPPGIWSRLPETYLLGPAFSPERLSEYDLQEQQLLTAVQLAPEPLSAKALAEQCGLPEKTTLRMLRAFCRQELLLCHPNLKPLPSEKKIVILRPALPPEEMLIRLDDRMTPQRKAVLDCILAAGSLPEKELCYRTGVSPVVVKALVRQGILAAEHLPEDAMPVKEPEMQASKIVLNEQQQRAYEGLCGLMSGEKPEVALLYGVTGSGKTLVYIRLIQHTLSLGKSAILLVPEIALTPQVVSRFRQYFGSRVAVLHSGLTVGQRYTEYCRIRRGQATVIIGTRTAVLAPAVNLGCILVDEEQEPSYKSETDPRYHARDVAKYRAAREGCLLVLGSATPSVESYYAAKTGAYHLFTLPSRFQNTPLPETVLADMRGQLRQGDPSRISSQLQAELQGNLERGEQSILFLNRRGSARMAACVDCGYIAMCENCSAAMTYHSRNGRLMCHHCGASVPMISTCPACGGTHIRLLGSGTQSVEDELQALFPTARILRMDADTTQGRTTHEALLKQFSQGEADILLGTQMVAKGLDFPNVTLVGVLEADLSLYCGGYHAPERTFSLLAQVVGRAGRRTTRGRAVIQTYTPENPVILAAAAQDYDAFYQQEIQTRQALKAPPFDDLFVFRLGGVDEASVREHARQLAALVRSRLGSGNAVLGPAPAALAKVNQRYYYTVSFRAKANSESRAIAAQLLVAAESLHHGPQCTVSADINPMTV